MNILDLLNQIQISPLLLDDGRKLEFLERTHAENQAHNICIHFSTP